MVVCRGVCSINISDSLLTKAYRTENRIILMSGSFEKRSPKRVAMIINIQAR